MNQGDYDEQNRVKASFDAAYTAPTPHRYLHNMTAVDYRMADYMNPYLSAVVDASLTSQEPERWSPIFGQVVKVESRSDRRNLECHERDGATRLS